VPPANFALRDVGVNVRVTALSDADCLKQVRNFAAVFGVPFGFEAGAGRVLVVCFAFAIVVVPTAPDTADYGTTSVNLPCKITNRRAPKKRREAGSKVEADVDGCFPG